MARQKISVSTALDSALSIIKSANLPSPYRPIDWDRLANETTYRDGIIVNAEVAVGVGVTISVRVMCDYKKDKIMYEPKVDISWGSMGSRSVTNAAACVALYQQAVNAAACIEMHLSGYDIVSDKEMAANG